MIPKEAIEKSIEGGWKPMAGFVKLRKLYSDGTADFYFEESEEIYPRSLDWHKIAFDALFWQGLAISLGWPIVDNIPARNWWGHAHNFCQLILAGSDTTKFWKELLTN